MDNEHILKRQKYSLREQSIFRLVASLNFSNCQSVICWWPIYYEYRVKKLEIQTRPARRQLCKMSSEIRFNMLFQCDYQAFSWRALHIYCWQIGKSISRRQVSVNDYSKYHRTNRFDWKRSISFKDWGKRFCKKDDQSSANIFIWVLQYQRWISKLYPANICTTQ